MRSHKVIRGILSSCIIFTVFCSTWAEEEEAKLHRLYHVKVKPGHGDAFYAALAEHAAWRREQGDPWTWYVHLVDTGENTGDYIIRSGSLKWADMDGYEEFGPKGGSKFWEDVGEHILDSDSWISAHDTRYTNYHTEQENVRLINVIHYELNPNMGEDFANAIKIYHDTIMEHGYPAYYQWNWMVSGYPQADAVLAIFFTNWADMAPNEENLSEFMIRIHGEEKTKEALEAFQTCVKSSSSMILRYLPELSIIHEE